MSVKHIIWQIVAVVFITPVFAENIEESPDEPKTYEFEEIVVTGSRIKSAESLSPAPVVVLSSDENQSAGIDFHWRCATNTHSTVQRDQYPVQQRR